MSWIWGACLHSLHAQTQLLISDCCSMDSLAAVGGVGAMGCQHLYSSLPAQPRCFYQAEQLCDCSGQLLPQCLRDSCGLQCL